MGRVNDGVMSDYQPPSWRDHFRIYYKACRIVVEPLLVFGLMYFLSAPWWAFVALAIIWVPYGRQRVRDLTNEWDG